MNLQDILEQIAAGSETVNCGCGACALQEKAEKSDSKQESEDLQLKAHMYATLRENLKGLAKSLPDRENSERKFRETASQLESIGYPMASRLILAYIDFVDNARTILDSVKEETRDHRAAASAQEATA